MNIVAVCHGCREELKIYMSGNGDLDTEKCPRCKTSTVIQHTEYEQIVCSEPGVSIYDKDVFDAVEQYLGGKDEHGY